MCAASSPYSTATRRVLMAILVQLLQPLPSASPPRHHHHHTVFSIITITVPMMHNLSCLIMSIFTSMRYIIVHHHRHRPSRRHPARCRFGESSLLIRSWKVSCVCEDFVEHMALRAQSKPRGSEGSSSGLQAEASTV